MGIDSHDDVIVGGSVCAGSPSFCLESSAAIKYAGETGDIQWVGTYVINDPNSAGGSSRGLAIDCRDNVYLTGFDSYFTNRTDAITLSWSKDGALRWADQYRPAGGRLAQGKSVAIDSTGAALMGGNYDTGPGTSFYLTIKYGAQAADLNGNGCIDLSDLAVMLAAYGNSTDGDLNCDGRTDLSDLALLLSQYGQGC